MKRTIRVAGPLALGLIAVSWLGAQPPKQGEKSQMPDAAHICAALRRPTTIDKTIENIPLREALDFFSEKYDIAFIVDEKAFDEVGNKNILDASSRLPKTAGVSLSTALRYLLGPHDATFLVRHDYVEITTNNKAVREIYSATVAEKLPPVINVVFQQTPLDIAAGKLADQSGLNVVLDRRAVEKDMPAVSVRLLNAPVDTAARLIAGLAGLRVAVLDNVYFITTKETAAVLECEHAKTIQLRQFQMGAAVPAVPARAATPPPAPAQPPANAQQRSQ